MVRQKEADGLDCLGAGWFVGGPAASRCEQPGETGLGKDRPVGILIGSRGVADSVPSQWESSLLSLSPGPACSCPATPGSSELPEYFKREEVEMEVELGRFPGVEKESILGQRSGGDCGLCGRTGVGGC